MSNPLDDLYEDIRQITAGIIALEGGLVDAKLRRGRLWIEVARIDADALPDAIESVGAGLSEAGHERWLAGVYPDGPINEWLTWSAHRDLAPLDQPTREAIIAEAEAAGLASSEHVRRLAREEKARRRGAGADSPDADPVTATTRAAYFVARFEAEFAVDFDASTIARMARVAEQAAAEWETAGTKTIADVFGSVPARAGAEA